VSCTWRGTSPRSGSRRTCCLCRRSGRVRSGSRMSTCTQSPRGKSADASSISCHSRRCRLQRARGGRYYPFVRARSWAISIVCSPVSGCDMSRSLTLNRFAQVRSSRARCRLTRRCCCVAFVTATTCSTRARTRPRGRVSVRGCARVARELLSRRSGFQRFGAVETMAVEAPTCVPKRLLKGIFSLHKRAGRLAGAEGLEPPAYGFGDRRSTN
jgi:hypothetical protein